MLGALKVRRTMAAAMTPIAVIPWVPALVHQGGGGERVVASLIVFLFFSVNGSSVLFFLFFTSRFEKKKMSGQKNRVAPVGGVLLRFAARTSRSDPRRE